MPDLRLTEIGRKLGIIDDARWQAFEQNAKRLQVNKNGCAIRG